MLLKYDFFDLKEGFLELRGRFYARLKKGIGLEARNVLVKRVN